MLDEEMIVSNLLLGDIEQLRLFVSSWIKDFYKSYDPRKSLNKTQLLDFICDLHDLIYDFVVGDGDDN